MCQDYNGARFDSGGRSNEFNSILKAEQIQTKAAEKLNEGDILSALELYSQANDVHSSGNILYNIGICNYQLGKIDEALRSWESSLKDMPMEADVHVNIANVYYLNKKNTEKAIEHLGIANSISPNDGEIAYNYGCILDATGRLEEAIEKYKVAFENNIPNAQVNIRNALIKLSSKKLQ
ncbi:putative UDP-N-acetylglucosamine-peptide N-acetylglucosaminyltransferase SEC [Smittium culicis]|uniref:Putative UDP-N-acetylglucosamine-peptide N-acetylglucosaminyltransferase SEC n=1 Tax=Smittium culicis TaxID=133412 RepID=A0A1R1XVK9_9FUNG|nr:putative UDP-N-acetylglucosamine-peptide N-acetylglucosaminyltransferase SEC [Smittium culicis]OMJ29443.1 putative UDP-N-acetylglucosamine-peptide N-acetylglucosaminyltransferase SEC [Smittium culicis]